MCNECVLSQFNPLNVCVPCVAEQVRSFFPAVDQLIASTKKVFVKAPSRVSLYKQMCPNLPIPPAPILTRWGTWLEAANFFTQNFSSIKNVIDLFDSDDAVAIQKAKEAIENPIVQQHLAYINSNFGTIPMTITKLEAQGLTLVECLDILLELRGTIRTATGEIGLQVNQKFEKVLENNPGFSRMLDIAKVLCGGIAEIQMAPDMIAAMKFAPISSCDVERTFSVYKNVLADNRTNFTPENLEMYLVCNCEKR